MACVAGETPSSQAPLGRARPPGRDSASATSAAEGRSSGSRCRQRSSRSATSAARSSTERSDGGAGGRRPRRHSSAAGGARVPPGPAAPCAAVAALGRRPRRRGGRPARSLPAPGAGAPPLRRRGGRGAVPAGRPSATERRLRARCLPRDAGHGWTPPPHRPARAGVDAELLDPVPRPRRPPVSPGVATRSPGWRHPSSRCSWWPGTRKAGGGR